MEEREKKNNLRTLFGIEKIPGTDQIRNMVDDIAPDRLYGAFDEALAVERDTLVLMADGSLREISAVKRGDEIATPQRPRRVMFVSTPLRGDRTLYSFGEHTFQFSGTHPFKTKRGYACVEPNALCSFIPTFHREDVEDFKEGVRLKNSQDTEIEVTDKKSHSCNESEREELLYDLIPEMDESGVFEYYIGDEKVQYLVASEIPVIFGKKYEGYSFMKMFDIIVEPILHVTADVPECDFWEHIQRMLWGYVRHELLPRFASVGNTIDMEKPKVSVDTSLFSKYVYLFEDTNTNVRIGLLFSAAFHILLPIFLNNPISLNAAEIMGNMIADEIVSKSYTRNH
jgi:hypothetical protein